MKLDQSLASYTDPPVIEVAASVQFDPLPGFSVVHFGMLWDRFRAKFPKVEQKPPIAPVVERLGVRAPLNQVQFQVSEDPGELRVWFVNESGDELVQVQPDRFIRNWRAIPGGSSSVYPRYEKHIRPEFLHDFRQFVSFVNEEIGDKAEPNQCEMIYINHITPSDVWSSHSDVAEVFRGWGVDPSVIGEPLEAVNFRTVHRLSDSAGEFVGRLHVSVQSAFKASKQPQGNDEPLFVLTLTARGRPLGPGEDGVLGFLDAGRSAIVRAFDSMTTPQMHRAWGKQ